MYTQLGRMRYATVNEFRGRKMVNIREYYDADGELRPGKKGWYDVLCVLFTNINKAVEIYPSSCSFATAHTILFIWYHTSHVS